MINNLPGVSDVVFIDSTALTVEQNLIGGYEKAFYAATGETISLYPGDPRRIFLLSIASEIIQLKSDINFTGKMNLLRYAKEDYLDFIGEQMNVMRLRKSAAVTTMRYILSTPLAHTEVIPKGTRRTPDGKLFFATTKEGVIPAGNISVDIPAECQEVGTLGNGFLSGQISRAVDPLPWVQQAYNITVSEGGADDEDDEHLRERIHLAPEAFSVAGSYGAYKFWAMSAHQDIIDISVVGPDDNDKVDFNVSPGEVYIFPMLRDGKIPAEEILNLVKETLNAEHVRPLTDRVFVQAPTAVLYQLKYTFFIHNANAFNTDNIRKAEKAECKRWISWQREAVGRDINTDYLIYLLRAAGVNRVVLEFPPFVKISPAQVAVLNGDPDISYGGLEDG